MFGYPARLFQQLGANGSAIPAEARRVADTLSPDVEDLRAATLWDAGKVRLVATLLAFLAGYLFLVGLHPDGGPAWFVITGAVAFASVAVFHWAKTWDQYLLNRHRTRWVEVATARALAKQSKADIALAVRAWTPLSPRNTYETFQDRLNDQLRELGFTI